MIFHSGRRTSALTLVEVVCALVLLSVTVTALLAAQARSLEQLRASERQARAAQMAQELIDQWRLEHLNVAVDGEGWFENAPEWSWLRRVRQLDDVDLLEIRLTILWRTTDGVQDEIANYIWLDTTDER